MVERTPSSHTTAIHFVQSSSGTGLTGYLLHRMPQDESFCAGVNEEERSLRQVFNNVCQLETLTWSFHVKRMEASSSILPGP